MRKEKMNSEPVIHKFFNQDQASLFLSRMRSEGHRAYLLDQGTGWLWGPIAVGGIRVAVYELTEEEQEIDVPPAPKPMRNIFPEWISMAALAFVATGVVAGMIFVFQEVGSADFSVTKSLKFIPLYVIAPTAFALLMMPVILGCMRALRSPGSPLGMFLRLFVWAYIVIWFGMLGYSFILVIRDIVISSSWLRALL